MRHPPVTLGQLQKWYATPVRPRQEKTSLPHPPDFFDGLERIESANGPTFRKKKQLVLYFPDEITFDLKTTVASCSPGGGRQEQPTPPQDFPKSLCFKFEWKVGTGISPAENLSQEIRGPSQVSPSQAVWHYLIRVKSHNIPLTAHLVVSIFPENGERLARVSVSL